jgi:hypothetical protein
MHLSNAVILLLVAVPGLGGCADIRVTDPYATATQEFLETEATRQAIARIAAGPLRDRKVYIDGSFLTGGKQTSPGNLVATQPPTSEQLFLLGEFRAHLLMNGVRICSKPEEAEIIIEVRSGGMSVDRTDFLLGLPGLTVSVGVGASTPVTTPELAIIKSTKQFGFASVAYVAYWRETGEIVASSGPFVGRTVREDYWLFGTGPSTIGNIPPAMPPPPTSQPGE